MPGRTKGDPLRRTFLETVIQRLQEVKWVGKDDWDKRIDVLANRREEVSTEDSLTVTGWGRVIALTLLLVPIGGAFISAALREDVTLYGGPIAWRFLIFSLLGAILSFSPLLVLLFNIGFRKENSANDDVLSLFFNKGPTARTTVTSRTANPTSIEFEETFTKLLQEAIESNEERRIVLILDNLDRVDASDALTIWSTLQTFFQHKGGATRPDWHKRLWFLVLYDYNGLSQLWAKDGNADGANTALSFIDKSFQVRFEVPSLVLSDWRNFLTSQLERAFPAHADPAYADSLHDVYRVLATNVAEKNKPLTIRELKLFVNQVGAVHRQWAGTGSFEGHLFPRANCILRSVAT